MITKIKEYFFNTSQFGGNYKNIEEWYIKQTIAFLNELEKENKN